MGLPLVPEVKIIMNGSVPLTSRCGTSGPAFATASAYAAPVMSSTVTPEVSRPSSIGAWSASTSSSWQSERRMSDSRPSPRRVVLMPHST